jgi:hypothetical protein
MIITAAVTVATLQTSATLAIGGGCDSLFQVLDCPSTSWQVRRLHCCGTRPLAKLLLTRWQTCAVELECAAAAAAAAGQTV